MWQHCRSQRGGGGFEELQIEIKVYFGTVSYSK